jgi:outer membrane protein OmpA-like peptidoglycan-associated protein
VIETVVVDNPPVASGFFENTLKNTEVFMSIYDAQKNRVIQGEIEVVDTERGRLISKMKGNEYVMLPDPKSKSGQISLICSVFGYRRLQREIAYPTPVTDEQAELFGNFFVVKFDMVRYQKGDIHTLYKVFFYNDAAVMLPESRYELNSLLDMMNENPRYKIVLHGHSNGNARGKIIMMGPSKDFFAITKDVRVVENGSARELSNQRALTIREWLIANGVAPDRVDVKPWGGKRMIHDKMGVNAKKNIRVEVEVVED